MSVKLKDLINQVDHGSIRLVAGKNGYSNPVEWVHMVESVEIADFLVGGEVAFTTGIGIRGDVNLIELVESVYQNRASGMVINVGPYIPEITEEVISFGNVHDFPIFEVPWSVHMAEIMRVFCSAINRSEQREMELSAAFRYAIYAPKQEDLYVPALMQKGYSVEWSYVISILEICDCVTGEKGETFYAPILKERLNLMKKYVANSLTQSRPDAAVFVDGAHLVIVLSDLSESEAAGLMEQTRLRLMPCLKSQEMIFGAVGEVVHGVRKISESYRMAKKIMDVSKIGHVQSGTRTYSSMGLNRLLFHVDSMESLETFYVDTVKPLEEYDLLNGSNLMEVLEAYMKNDGSVQKTSEELYVHRNTVNYKIKKIETLLSCDLTKFSVRNELAAGLLVAKLRKCSG